MAEEVRDTEGTWRRCLEVGATNISQDATKRPSQGSGTEEQRDAELSLTPLVPHGEIVNNAGEKSGLCNTEEKAGGKESTEVLNHAHEGCNDAPKNCQRRQPKARSRPLENDVAGNLAENKLFMTTKEELHWDCHTSKRT